MSFRKFPRTTFADVAKYAEQVARARQHRPQVCNDRGAPGVDDCDCECHAAGLPPCELCRETADDDGRNDEVTP